MGRSVKRVAGLDQSCHFIERRPARGSAHRAVTAQSPAGTDQRHDFFAPGEAAPTLTAITFSVEPGPAVGIVGASGSGKPTLARTITGVWPTRAGAVRLDGAKLNQFNTCVPGADIGYLPHRVQLFDGTIAESIERLSASPDPERVAASKQASDP